MATANGTDQSYGPVLKALGMMSSNADRAQKGEAHEYLEGFQKSVSQFQFLEKSKDTNLQSRGRSMDYNILDVTVHGYIG